MLKHRSCASGVTILGLVITGSASAQPYGPFPNLTNREDYRLAVLADCPLTFLHDKVDSNSLQWENENTATGSESGGGLFNAGVGITWTESSVMSFAGANTGYFTSVTPILDDFDLDWDYGWTIEFWMRSDDPGGRVIFHTQNQYDSTRLTLRITEDLEFEVFQLQYNDDTEYDWSQGGTVHPDQVDGRWWRSEPYCVLDDDAWLHVAVVFHDATNPFENFALYINKCLKESNINGNGLGFWSPFDAPAYIGRAPSETWGPAYNNFVGDLASFALYPEALDGTDIAAHYDAATQ